MEQSRTRPPTTVDRVMEEYLLRYAELDPVSANELGITGHEHALPDLSPDGLAELSAVRRRTLAALDDAEPADATDRITIAAARERLEVAEEFHAAGLTECLLNNMDSPPQRLRRAFDLMPTENADDWTVIATRLAAVPSAIAGYLASLRRAAARGQVAPRRQLEAVVGQCRDLTGPTGYFARLAGDAGPALPRTVRSAVEQAARDAAAAYEQLGSFLRYELDWLASDRDAVGRERYALWSRASLGTTVDLPETYEWARQELNSIGDEMRQVAEQIAPGASVAEAMRRLTSDPARLLRGTDALRSWMQERSDEAIRALAGTHFDIPEPVRVLECRIAPTPGGGIYYTSPSEDFNRPGRTWWGVPNGATEFSTWQQLSTVYHEGVPGHHLQVGQAIYRADLLNRWRRLGCWVDGHGEGWALYAERLMAELGFLDEPGARLGMLDSQSFRAVRVVIDIGFHCGFPAPAEVGGGSWTYDKALRYLGAHSSKAPDRLRYEVDRYLGLPGQATSYKIGERWWLRLRDEVAAREGAAFDLRTFHRRALDIGSVGLHVLRAALLGSYDYPARTEER